MDDHEQAFRSAFFPMYAASMTVGVVVALVVVPLAAFLNPGLSLSLSGFLVGVLVGGCLGAFLTALAVAALPVYVGSSGIRCYNLWGMYRTIAWGDIDSVRPLVLGNLRYLLVSDALGHVLTVPLFLSKMQRFHSSVVAVAGSENALSQALDEALALGLGQGDRT